MKWVSSTPAQRYDALVELVHSNSEKINEIKNDNNSPFKTKIGKLEKDPSKSAYADIIDWFENKPGLELLDDATDVDYKKELDSVKPLNELIKKYQPETSKEDTHFIKEFVLWGLVEYDKLSKDRTEEGYQFKDLYSSYINKL